MKDFDERQQDMPRRRQLPRPRGEDEDERIPLRRRREEDAPIHPGRQLLHLMRQLDGAREAVVSACGAIQRHLAEHEELKQMYADFQERGGGTAADMSAWLVDDDWRRKDMVLRNGNLRLISSRSPAVVRKVKRVRLDDGPEAA